MCRCDHQHAGGARQGAHVWALAPHGKTLHGRHVRRRWARQRQEHTHRAASRRPLRQGGHRLTGEPTRRTSSCEKTNTEQNSISQSDSSFLSCFFPPQVLIFILVGPHKTLILARWALDLVQTALPSKISTVITTDCVLSVASALVKFPKDGQFW